MEHKDNRTFINIYRGPITDELMKDPTAFMLLTQIALRARRTDSYNDKNLLAGESLVGDYKGIGATRAQYRRVLEKLSSAGFIAIRTTNRGTIAKLLNTTVFSINGKIEQPTPQPSDNHQATTNNNDNNIKKDIIDRLPTNKKFFFYESDKHNLTEGPLSELCNNPKVHIYIKTGVDRIILDKDLEFSIPVTKFQALFSLFVRKGLLTEKDYKTLGEVLRHCIKWIGVNLQISEAASKTNYKLAENALFWDIFHGRTSRTIQIPSKNHYKAEVIIPDKQKSQPVSKIKTSKSRLDIDIMDQEISQNEAMDSDLAKSGVFWDLRHNYNVTMYIIQRLPSPLQDFEVYVLWTPFLYTVTKGYYSSAKIIVDSFIKWIKKNIRQSKSSDIHSEDLLSNYLKSATVEKYSAAMASYQNKIQMGCEL
ncbi:MAG: hypothetical protein K0S44_1881 [Bacteroidetes bacterium]|jgi:hypothetical protein|nr:hypothetical protein [Bacteroidota bacterium]